MQEASAASSTFAVPEPDLTPREIVARAAAMRPELLERQAETEERTFYAQDTHEASREAGFYRILQPRRFGGYEFDLETYFRVIIEIARGCPSTGLVPVPRRRARPAGRLDVRRGRPRPSSSAPTGTSCARPTAPRSASPSRATTAT